MPTPPLSDELALEAAAAKKRFHNSDKLAAESLGMNIYKFRKRVAIAARRGFLLDHKPAMPGFVVSKVSTTENEDGEVIRRSIQQRPEPGGPASIPEGHTVKGVSTLSDGDGNTLAQWTKTVVDAEWQAAAFQAYLDGLKDEIPREASVPPPDSTQSDLLSQYTITDSHLGMLAWHEEAGEDYDLAEAERLLRGFLSTAIAMSPPSDTAILAQLGDFLHYDGHKPLTPEHGNLLDTDTRFGKVVRVALRVLRWCARELLKKHAHVHILLADANHDPASGVWLREAFAMLFDEEPRVTVDTSASTYYAYQWGDVALFYHHGHKRGMKDVDAVFAGRFREAYGKSKHAYAHLGHRHSDEARTSHLMKIEQHETLAAKDAYAAQGGFPGGRSAKVIHYHKRFGEVSRSIITPEMISG